MFDGRWRGAVDRSTGPVGQALHRRGITADVLTATGLISASATAVAVATGHLHIAIILLILTGLHDLLDGPVAKAAGTASVRGAFFDSVTDRVADAVLMGGVAWYLIGRQEGHLAVLPLAVLGVTALVSYERAKAESLGLSAKGGLMERAERMILLGDRLHRLRLLAARSVGHVGADHHSPPSPGSSRCGTPLRARTRSSAVALRPGVRVGSIPGGAHGVKVARVRACHDERLPRHRAHRSGRWRARRQVSTGQPDGSDDAGASCLAAHAKDVDAAPDSGSFSESSCHPPTCIWAQP